MVVDIDVWAMALWVVLIDDDNEEDDDDDSHRAARETSVLLFSLGGNNLSTFIEPSQRSVCLLNW